MIALRSALDIVNRTDAAHRAVREVGGNEMPAPWNTSNNTPFD
jgi:hypothetical protein